MMPGPSFAVVPRRSANDRAILEKMLPVLFCQLDRRDEQDLRRAQ